MHEGGADGAGREGPAAGCACIGPASEMSRALSSGDQQAAATGASVSHDSNVHWCVSQMAKPPADIPTKRYPHRGAHFRIWGIWPRRKPLPLRRGVAVAAATSQTRRARSVGPQEARKRPQGDQERAETGAGVPSLRRERRQVVGLPRRRTPPEADASEEAASCCQRQTPLEQAAARALAARGRHARAVMPFRPA